MNSVKDISYYIGAFVAYGLVNNLIEANDQVYTRNRLLYSLEMTSYDGHGYDEGFKDMKAQQEDSRVFMNAILNYAVAQNIIEEDTVSKMDMFDSRLMNLLIDRPSNIINKFYRLYDEDKTSATAWFYKICCDSNYIRLDRVKKNIKWSHESKYGTLKMTINMSKPEKTSKEIEMASQVQDVSYPPCVLCKENEGYSGNATRQARVNHRIIPLELNNEKWYFQYSPYQYFNEHSIVFSDVHRSMTMSMAVIKKLLDFVDMMPHYFIGSNSDLPIIGGSILSHEHFQCGRYKFPIEESKVIKSYSDLNGIEIDLLKWPLTVFRIKGCDRLKVEESTQRIVSSWMDYRDSNQKIVNKTGGVQHNSMTPIVRCKDQVYEIDLVLRNNRRSKTHPYGIFHPRESVHNIKKENIGLIEVMGLAILPSRLKRELQDVSNCISQGLPVSVLPQYHRKWAASIMAKYKGLEHDMIEELVFKSVGDQFIIALEDAGVFKQNSDGIMGADKFIMSIEGFSERI